MGQEVAAGQRQVQRENHVSVSHLAPCPLQLLGGLPGRLSASVFMCLLESQLTNTVRPSVGGVASEEATPAGRRHCRRTGGGLGCTATGTLQACRACMPDGVAGHVASTL